MANSSIGIHCVRGMTGKWVWSGRRLLMHSRSANTERLVTELSTSYFNMNV